MPSRRSGSDRLWLAPATSTGSPPSSAVTPGGGFSRARMSSKISCWRSSGTSRTPNARLAVLRSAVMTDWEKYGGTASSSPRTCSFVAAARSSRKRSVSDSAGHSSALPQPFVAE